jgi:hypothetical protein
LSEQEGVKNIILSGMRATVIMEEGKALAEAKVTDALGARKIKFLSMEVVDRAVPAVMFNLKATGVT